MTSTTIDTTTTSTGLLGAGLVGSAVNGGVLLGFSLLTMPGLDDLAATDPRGAVTAMQAVNDVAQTPPFMVVLFGTALVSVVLAVQGLRRRGVDGWLTAAGAALFLLGVIGLTIVVNVPLGDRGRGPARRRAFRSSARPVIRGTPGVPPRTGLAGLVPRILFAAAGGRVLARRRGRVHRTSGVVASGAAVGAAFGGVRWRAAAAGRWGSDLPGALVEDLAAVACAWWATRR